MFYSNCRIKDVYCLVIVKKIKNKFNCKIRVCILKIY